MDQQHVADKLEIAELLDRYAAAVDARDWDAFRAAFTTDALLDYSDESGPRGSVDDVVAWLREVLSPFTVMQHLITNKLIDLDGDRGTSVAYFYNPMGVADAEGRMDMLFVGGRYEDVLARTPDGWRIAERLHRTAWMVGGGKGRGEAERA